jgi:hypothetical protein
MTCSRSDSARQQLGFLSVAETDALNERGLVVLDPSSTLISRDATVGPESILYPGVVLEVASGGRLEIGERAILYPGLRIAVSGGAVMIGEACELGDEGGFTITVQDGERTDIGDGARLLGGGSLAGRNHIGDGAQILGPIRCRDCSLGDGGSHREPDPDLRGAVLKGAGVARNVTLARGDVIQSFGLFSDGPVRRQVEFHPKAEA